MTIQQLWTPVKRELWEHKAGLLWTPAAVALLLILAFLYMVAFHDFSSGALVGDVKAIHKMEFNDGGTNLSSDKDNPPEGVAIVEKTINKVMFIVVGIINFLLWLPLAIVLLIYAHSTLFDDRKNREILFWRSMPVSETQNVLTKFFVIGVVAPTIVFLLTFVCVLLFLLFGVAEVVVGASGRFAEIPSLLSLWFTVEMYGAILRNLIVLLPFVAWMVFSSAAAKKSPVMFSSVVPFSLVVLDRMANSFFGVDLHIVSAFNRYWDLLRMLGPTEKMVFTPDLVLPFTIAMLVAGLLILATIWLRNNRYEI